MKIAIDARWIFPEISGIGSYTRELIEHLIQADNRHSYLFFFDNTAVLNRTVAEAGLRTSMNVSTLLLPFGVFSLRNQLQLPRILACQNVDVFHSTNYMIPLFSFPKRGKPRYVATVHDVIPMIFPDLVPKSKKARVYPLYRWLMKRVGTRADIIVTDSHASKTDIVKHLRIANPSKVRPIYCGVSERFRPAPRRAQTDSSRPRTLLYVGRADPYKNLAGVIRALPQIREQCPFPVTLTVAGSPDPRYPEAQHLAVELKVNDFVNWTGYLSDEALTTAYQQADVLVHPSLYEGFGLQVVEAMACGLPVVCSNAGSLPEVVGEAAIAVPPNDIVALTGRIAEVLTREALAREMSEKGIRQAAQFTWSRTAAETLAVYEEFF
jgi:glycosyltransferase involved in cell wall biosynthesis